MFKISNVRLYSVFAIMLIGLVGLGYITMVDKTGYVSASQKKWDVGVNESSYASYGVGVELASPTITGKEIEFNVQLNNKGDYKTYTFEVENLGNVDAHFVSANSSAETSSDATITYTVSKGDSIIYDSVSDKLNNTNNHLYQNGKNLVEVTIRNDSENAVAVKYTLKLNYEED